MSDYEEAIERLRQLKHRDVVEFRLAAYGAQDAQLLFRCQIDFGAGITRRCVVTHGKNALDAACFAIDQFRNSLLKEEEEKKLPVYAGVDLAGKGGYATVYITRYPDGTVKVKDSRLPENEHLKDGVVGTIFMPPAPDRVNELRDYMNTLIFESRADREMRKQTEKLQLQQAHQNGIITEEEYWELRGRQ